MKLIDGNFGGKGTALINHRNQLIIDSPDRHIYSPEQILTASARVRKEKTFSILSFVLSMVLFCAFPGVLLSVFFGLVLGALGILIGFGIAIAISFYSKETNFVEVRLDDQKSLILAGSSHDVNQLVLIAERGRPQ